MFNLWIKREVIGEIRKCCNSDAFQRWKILAESKNYKKEPNRARNIVQ
jgi:hypothetical protein